MLNDEMKDDDGFGDWRIAAASRLAKDLPADFPGGPSHKAGAAVYQSSLVVTESGENIGFLTPSATAMAFNIAIHASEKAMQLYSLLSYDIVLTPNGLGKTISNDKSKELYDFFEQCMIVASFSYQALETFCNHTIIRELTDPIEIKRRNKRVIFTPPELERMLSTSEKLSLVLPKIKGIPTPKGKIVWEPFKRLEEARDSTTHLKSKDQATVTKESLFFQFLSHQSTRYPKAAADMVRYFVREKEPRWLKLLNV